MTQNKHRVNGKLRMADTVIVKTLLWPHKVLYTPISQPIVYKNIPSVAFVDGYITVMGQEPSRIRSIMLTHLQELMEDGEM